MIAMRFFVEKERCGNKLLKLFTTGKLAQGQLQEWTEHSHTDPPKSETSRDIKKSF